MSCSGCLRVAVVFVSGINKITTNPKRRTLWSSFQELSRNLTTPVVQAQAALAERAPKSSAIKGEGTSSELLIFSPAPVPLATSEQASGVLTLRHRFSAVEWRHLVLETLVLDL